MTLKVVSRLHLHASPDSTSKVETVHPRARVATEPNSVQAFGRRKLTYKIREASRWPLWCPPTRANVSACVVPRTVLFERSDTSVPRDILVERDIARGLGPRRYPKRTPRGEYSGRYIHGGSGSVAARRATVSPAAKPSEGVNAQLAFRLPGRRNAEVIHGGLESTRPPICTRGSPLTPQR